MIDTSSKIGLGTYNTAKDQSEIISYALQNDYKLIDTAPNYDYGLSQNEISKALQNNPGVREKIIISTKAGFISNRSDIDLYVDKKIALRTDFVGNHCMSPSFIDFEVNKNLAELGVQNIDILFLHNPERQFGRLDKTKFLQELLKAFEKLEILCESGKISYYGISSWDGFSSKGKKGLFSLDDILELRNQTTSKSHFKYIQIPLSLVFYDELYNYVLENKGLLKDAENNSIKVFANSPLYKGELPRIMDDEFLSLFGHTNKAQACLLFLKSFPVIDKILVGATKDYQVKENKEVDLLPNIKLENLGEILALLSNGTNQ